MRTQGSLRVTTSTVAQKDRDLQHVADLGACNLGSDSSDWRCIIFSGLGVALPRPLALTLNPTLT